jgi:hypothetical protein
MASKPTNWKSLFQDLPTSIGIHSEKDLKSIRALTDGTINDIGTENIWFRLSRETDILYLFLSTNFEIQVLHHLDILGNRHYNENKTVGLCGLSAQASAVEIDIDRDLVHIQARVPKWDKIENSLTDIESLKALTIESIEDENQRIDDLIHGGPPKADADKTRADAFQNYSIIAIPAGLSRVIIETSDRNPASLASKFGHLMQMLDQEHDGETEGYASYMKYFRHLIYFLWLAHKKALHMVPYVLSDNSTVHEWSDRVHSAYLQPRILSAANLVSPTPETSALEKVAFSLSSLQDSLSLHKSSKEDETGESSGGFKKRFGPHLQQLFLNASATFPYEEAAAEPTSTFENFLSQKTLGGAKTFIRGHLQANPFLDFTPSAGMTTSAYTGNVQWDDTYTPRNFSIFYCGRQQNNGGTSSSYNDQALYLKEHIGNGINEKEVRQILKQEKTCPKDASEALDQIQNFLALCDFIFGSESKIAMSVKTWIQHINRNKSCYDSMQRTDSTFLSQILYCIDMAIQVHLTSCLTRSIRADVDDECLNFTVDQQNVTRRQFSITLPQSIKIIALSLSSDSKTTETDSGKRHGGGGRGGLLETIDKNRLKDENYRKRLIQELEGFNNPELESKKVKNTNPDKNWLLKPDEAFGAVFQTKIRTCPKQDRSFVCLKYWIKGECFKNCKFVHADLKPETKTEINAWIAKCRADFR